MSKKLSGQAGGIKILSENRQARHNYYFLETLEAGIVLAGTEVKAARGGKVQLRDAYAQVIENEAWLLNAHISHYAFGNRQNHEVMRKRKLLLHRREIDRLAGKSREGLALIPTKMYLKQGRIKCEIALAKGKKLHDKRESERVKEAQMEAKAAMGRFNKGR